MNREIKFRVWNGNKFIGITTPKEMLQDYPNSSEYGNVNDLIFQQFTGIKDKNGKETYEGDIVESKNIGQNWTTRGQIVFIKNVGSFAIQSSMLGIPAIHFLNEVPFEIIGNIFENPELLK